MTNVVEIKDLTYRKNQKYILKDVNLTLESGKIIALLGENGAGKTSLMRVIAGLAKNYRGEVTVQGESDPAKRKANLSFTDKLSGFGSTTKLSSIVDFYRNIYSDFDEEEFDQLRTFMNLDLNLRLGQLSRGTKEKLIIALTFSRRAKLYLLDEPFSGIDAMARKKIINSILLWKEEDATILISDHFVNEIAQLLDEVVIIKNHTVLTHQSADAIREQGRTIEEFYEAQYDEEE